MDVEKSDLDDGNINNFIMNSVLSAQVEFDENNANNNNSNNTYSDDGNQIKLTRKFSMDASLNPSVVHKEFQKSFESFQTCNYGNGK